MSELLHESFRLINLPFTLMLIIMVGYWLLVMLGALDGPGEGDVDGGHELDGDTDVHQTVEGHHQGHHAESGSWYGGALKFVNLGEVPVMVVLSVLILAMWTFNIFANAWFTGDSVLLKTGALFGNFALSAVVTRYTTMPLKPLFRMLNKQYDEKVEVVGRHCRVVSLEATPEFGQAEITTDGAPIVINVRVLNDAVLAKGDLAVIVREDAEHRIFYITANPIPNHS
jgi:hypothetical protein